MLLECSLIWEFGLPFIRAVIGVWVAQSRDRQSLFFLSPFWRKKEKTCPNTPTGITGWFYIVVQQYDCSIHIYLTDQVDTNLAIAMLCSVSAKILPCLMLWKIWHTGLTAVIIIAQGYIWCLTAEAPGTTA